MLVVTIPMKGKYENITNEYLYETVTNLIMRNHYSDCNELHRKHVMDRISLVY
jgi:phosphoribosylaminoimidazole-succinocarboxamide synthase